MVHLDQVSSQWPTVFMKPSGRLMGWKLRLSEFSIEIVCKKKRFNTRTDTLSRHTFLGHTTAPLDKTIATHDNPI